jgi:hypothetical protein
LKQVLYKITDRGFSYWILQDGFNSISSSFASNNWRNHEGYIIQSWYVFSPSGNV